nr:hypothetical protein Iba_chr04bCG7160 [Ipomoea batatas]
MGVWFELNWTDSTGGTYQLSDRTNRIPHWSNSWRASKCDVWERYRADYCNICSDGTQSGRREILSSGLHPLQPSSSSWNFSFVRRHCQHFKGTKVR